MEICADKGGGGPTPDGKCHLKFPFLFLEPFPQYLKLFQLNNFLSTYNCTIHHNFITFSTTRALAEKSTCLFILRIAHHPFHIQTFSPIYKNQITHSRARWKDIWTSGAGSRLPSWSRSWRPNFKRRLAMKWSSSFLSFELESCI